MRDFREQNFYELLDLQPQSSQQELERSYRRARRFFSPDSVATYALFQPDELNLLRRRIEEAFRTLGDPDKRKAYDQELARLEGDWNAQAGKPSPEAPAEPLLAAQPEPECEPGPAPESLPEPEARPEDNCEPEPLAGAPADPPPDPPAAASPATVGQAPGRPEMPVIGEDTDITGALLRQAREARGLSLDDYVRTTKISIYYLRNIEEEDFKDLPAMVYVRGYLRQMARLLGLDPQRVCNGFLERMQRAVGE